MVSLANCIKIINCKGLIKQAYLVWRVILVVMKERVKEDCVNWRVSNNSALTLRPVIANIRQGRIKIEQEIQYPVT